MNMVMMTLSKEDIRKQGKAVASLVDAVERSLKLTAKHEGSRVVAITWHAVAHVVPK